MIFGALLGHSTLWLVFLVATFLTIFLASKTVKYFTIFTTKSAISSSALGGIFLALITSLPELVTGIIGGIEDTPTLVYGNVTGANSILLVFYGIFNLFFLRKSMKHIPSRSLGITISVAGLSMLMFSVFYFARESITVQIGDTKLSILSIIQLLFYLSFLFYTIKGHGGDIEEEPTKSYKTKFKGKWTIFTVFLFFSALLVLSAILLNNAVTRMGDSAENGGYGLGLTLAGGLFLSVVTTLPEITSMFKLMKIGLFNVAASAGLGSHIFNFTILFLSDIIAPKSILETVYQENSRQQLYVWIIYLISFAFFISCIYNKYIKRKKHRIILNSIQIPICFVFGWMAYGLTG